MKHGTKAMGQANDKCAQHPKKGVEKVRSSAPRSTPRAPSVNWTYTSVPKDTRSKTVGSV